MFSIAALVAVVQLAFSLRDGFWIDEVYMLAAGKFHLDWGYADQPPLVPLLAAAMDRIAPGALPVLRLPAVLATAGAVVVTALIAREFGADRRAQVLSAGAAATGLWTSLIGHWVTPYTFEPLLWLLLTWSLVRWVRLRDEGRADDRLLLAFGALAGVTMETKVQVALLCGTLLVAVLAVGPRDVLRRPGLWGGAGIAAALALPTLIWQAQHGWPQLRMGAVVADESALLSGGRGGTAVTLVLYAGVAGCALVLIGVYRLLFSAELRSYRFFAVTILLLYGFFIATAGRPYYIVGLYGVAVAAGAVGLQRRRESGRSRWRWTAWLFYTASAAAAVFMLLASTSLARTFGLPTGDELPRRVAAAYAALPPAQRAHTAVVGEPYYVAAALEVGAAEYGLPEVRSPHRGYGYFGPPADRIDSVLYAGPAHSPLEHHFTTVRQLESGELSLWLLSGRTASWDQIWPRVQSLT
ncbi:glycosyltransferase family 39 protein [Saccharopolyspora rosea]|uniref:Glycosyltransferase family 39 protein n=1 Tax=Saccharopolyspora rosea TaxID=524884 RepID=A0ABW3G0B8_9PSEU|nr:glycosyltransferase family 39 protein [Saccharopolyspora rosea]